MKLIPYKKSAAARAWIRAESREQRQRYLRISRYINETLAPKRNKWIEAFLERLQSRGFSVHYDQLRKLTPAELPRQPRRRHRFVF